MNTNQIQLFTLWTTNDGNKFCKFKMKKSVLKENNDTKSETKE